MHRKIMALLMAAIVAIMAAVSAYAYEDTELPTWLGGSAPDIEGIEDEIFIPQTPLELPDGSHSTAKVGDTVGMEETVNNNASTFAMLNTGDGSTNPVVDVSDESIAAIADAITVGSYYEGNVEVSHERGSYYIPEEAYAFPYLYIRVVDMEVFVYCFASQPSGTTETVATPSATFRCEMELEAEMPGTYWRARENVEQPLGYYAYQGRSDIYSEFDVYYNGQKQSVFAISARTATITFVTGYDDLYVAPMSSNNFYLPSLHKDGVVFSGWSLDPNAYIPVPRDWIPTENTTLYAQWAAASAIIYFWQMLFSAMVTLFSTEPFSQIFGLIAFAMILAVTRLFINTR